MMRSRNSICSLVDWPDLKACPVVTSRLEQGDARYAFSAGGWTCGQSRLASRSSGGDGQAVGPRRGWNSVLGGMFVLGVLAAVLIVATWTTHEVFGQLAGW